MPNPQPQTKDTINSPPPCCMLTELRKYTPAQAGPKRLAFIWVVFLRAQPCPYLQDWAIFASIKGVCAKFGLKKIQSF